MKKCTLSGYSKLYGACSAPGTKIDWHHTFIYAGKQINEPWAIVGACQIHHRMVGSDKAIRQAFETASLMEATEEDLTKYPKKDWEQIKRSLGIKQWPKKSSYGC